MAEFTAHDGEVFLRGVYTPADQAERQLAVYRRSAAAGDWWSPFAAELAADLEAAMRAAQRQHRKVA